MHLVRPNALPATNFVHPAARFDGEGDGDFALDVASEAAPNYLRWVADLCRPYLGDSVLEVGAGIGTITKELADGRPVLATDISDPCIAALEERFAKRDDVRVAKADLRTFDPGERFDSVVMVNVIEHIRDDAAALSALRRFLNPGGSLIVYTPALNGLYGAWDLRVGHYRRYSRWRLREVLREAGYEVAELRYVNSLAIPAWIAFSVMSRTVDETGGRSLSIWDRTGVPVTRALEARIRPPLGLNVLAVGVPS